MRKLFFLLFILSICQSFAEVKTNEIKLNTLEELEQIKNKKEYHQSLDEVRNSSQYTLEEIELNIAKKFTIGKAHEEIVTVELTRFFPGISNNLDSFFSMGYNVKDNAVYSGQLQMIVTSKSGARHHLKCESQYYGYKKEKSNFYKKSRFHILLDKKKNAHCKIYQKDKWRTSSVGSFEILSAKKSKDEKDYHESIQEIRHYWAESSNLKKIQSLLALNFTIGDAQQKISKIELTQFFSEGKIHPVFDGLKDRRSGELNRYEGKLQLVVTSEDGDRHHLKCDSRYYQYRDERSGQIYKSDFHLALNKKRETDCKIYQRGKWRSSSKGSFEILTKQ